MNHADVDLVANAILYEGYLLYPYRLSSVKNRTRWTFGGVHPRAWSEAHGGTEPYLIQAECLLRHASSLRVRVRFLHLVDRPDGQEAVEREVAFDAPLDRPHRVPFVFGPGRDGDRTHRRVEGEIEFGARPIDGLTCLTLRVVNLTPLDDPVAMTRDGALRHSLVSTHAILHAPSGEFVSLLDPPEECRAAADRCRNVGVWPVLAGPEGTTNTVLASPIILYDYPKVAPESPGDLFDATEIDEILTLRILTLTDAEKAEMCAADERARRMLERTEALARDQLLGLHGATRSLRRLPEGTP